MYHWAIANGSIPQLGRTFIHTLHDMTCGHPVTIDSAVICEVITGSVCDVVGEDLDGSSNHRADVGFLVGCSAVTQRRGSNEMIAAASATSPFRTI